MASVTSVRVQMKPGYQKDVCQYPMVKGAVTEMASDMASRANSMGAGFRTGHYTDPKTHERRGGTQPRYASERARETSSGCVAIVHPANYAAMKDNHLHNTLLKSMKRG